MRYHNDGVLKIGQVIFEPGNRMHVEVVGRLVEQQNIGIPVKGLGKEHAYLLIPA